MKRMCPQPHLSAVFRTSSIPLAIKKMLIKEKLTYHLFPTIWNQSLQHGWPYLKSQPSVLDYSHIFSPLKQIRR